MGQNLQQHLRGVLAATPFRLHTPFRCSPASWAPKPKLLRPWGAAWFGPLGSPHPARPVGRGRPLADCQASRGALSCLVRWALVRLGSQPMRGCGGWWREAKACARCGCEAGGSGQKINTIGDRAIAMLRICDARITQPRGRHTPPTHAVIFNTTGQCNVHHMSHRQQSHADRPSSNARPPFIDTH